MKVQKDASLRITTKEQEQRVIKNMHIVHNVAKRYEEPGTDMYDEVVSVGYIALVKAAILYEPERKTPFYTYVSNSIIQKIDRYCNQHKKRMCRQVYLNDLLLNNEEDADLANLPEYIWTDFSEEIHESEWALYILNIMLSILKPKQMVYMLHLMAGYNRTEIGRKMHFTRQRSVQIEKVSIEKIRKYLMKSKKRQRRFRIVRDFNSYKFIFKNNDSSQNIAIVKELCDNQKIAKLSNYRISCDEKGIVVEGYTENYFFEFIAYTVETINKVTK